MLRKVTQAYRLSDPTAQPGVEDWAISGRGTALRLCKLLPTEQARGLIQDAERSEGDDEGAKRRRAALRLEVHVEGVVVDQQTTLKAGGS